MYEFLFPDLCFEGILQAFFEDKEYEVRERERGFFEESVLLVIEFFCPLSSFLWECIFWNVVTIWFYPYSFPEGVYVLNVV